MSFISGFADVFDKSVWSVVIAAIVIITGYLSRPVYESKRKKRLEKQIFKSQCADIKRHFQANVSVLKSLIRDKKSRTDECCLRPIHLKKLRLLSGMADFNFDLYNHLNAKDVGVIQQHKLLMRNIEIDIDEAISIYFDEEVEELYEFFGYLIERFENACANIERTLNGEDFQQMPITIAYRRKIV